MNGFPRCAAGVSMSNDSAPGWQTPCPNVGTLVVVVCGLGGKDVPMMLCPGHMADLEALGVLDEPTS